MILCSIGFEKWMWRLRDLIYIFIYCFLASYSATNRPTRKGKTLPRSRPTPSYTQRQNVTFFQTKLNSRHPQRQNVTLIQNKLGSRHSQRQNVTLFQTKPNSRLSQRQNVTLFQNNPNSTDFMTDAIGSPHFIKIEKGGT